MSSRIRILFHCAIEGPTCHVGRKALLAMWRLLKPGPITNLPQLEWVDHTTWLARSKPPYKERQLDFSQGSPYYIYRVARKASGEAPAAPAFKNLTEEARWLWEHLPQDIRAVSQLIVTRESRSSQWRRSRCNPSKYGWKIAGDKKKAPPKVPKGWIFGSMDYAFNSWDPQPSIPGQAPLSALNATSGGLEAALQEASDFINVPGPVNPVPKALDKASGKSVAYDKYKKAFGAGAGLSTGPVQSQKAAPPNYPYNKPPRNKQPKVKFLGPEEDFPEDDETLPKTVGPGKKTGPPKLKIGIWA
jgi:hypothetical protein